MSAQLTHRPPARRRFAVRAATTVAAWLIAYGLVLAVLEVGGRDLAALPIGLRAAITSGVLVTAMTTVIMPALSAAARRWLAGPPWKPDAGS